MWLQWCLLSIPSPHVVNTIDKNPYLNRSAPHATNMVEGTRGAGAVLPEVVLPWGHFREYWGLLCKATCSYGSEVLPVRAWHHRARPWEWQAHTRPCVNLSFGDGSSFRECFDKLTTFETVSFIGRWWITIHYYTSLTSQKVAIALCLGGESMNYMMIYDCNNLYDNY